jgi:hypothetical protein
MTVATLVYTRRLDLNSIIGTVSCFIVFGIPFGYIMGLKMVRTYADKIKKIQNGDFQIKKDLLVKKEMLLNGADTSNNSYQLEFRDWSRETDKVFKVNYRKYLSVEENKEYYLVFIDGYVDPCGIYPVDEFELSL